MTSSTALPEGTTSLDRLVQAWQARFTGGLSPASLGLSYFDWLVHLDNTPGKQTRLGEDAWRAAMQLSLYAAQSADPHAKASVEPRPQDHRFTGAPWQWWPFNLLSQSFLMAEQWWQSATTGIPGVSRHHKEVVSFFGCTNLWLPTAWRCTGDLCLRVVGAYALERMGAVLYEPDRKSDL